MTDTLGPMASRPVPAVPDAVPMAHALARCEPLTRLNQRLAQARAHMDAVRPLLPAYLQPQVRSGPVDDDGWTLLATNAGVAAKLRQLLPRLQAALPPTRAGEPTPIRIRVQSS